MSEPDSDRRRRAAFAPDRSRQIAAGVLKAAWWGGAAVALRAIARPRRREAGTFAAANPPPPDGFLRQAWLEAFEADAADVAAGLYPPMLDSPADAGARLRETLDVMLDAPEVAARRRRAGGAEARDDTPTSGAFPAYYRQNFHFQSGGWFTAESARRYEGQVEALFAGTAGAMRRRALSLLATAWRDRDHRGLKLLDLACGSGAFLDDLARTFPRARLIGADLSAAYLAEAQKRGAASALVQANAERLPFADASLDAVTCIYLFHELPPPVRPRVAAEIARVLKPGGVLALADSLQPTDEPRLALLLEAFPAYFHEPFYASYGETDLTALFDAVGLAARAENQAFLTKAMLFEKSNGRPEQWQTGPTDPPRAAGPGTG